MWGVEIGDDVIIYRFFYWVFFYSGILYRTCLRIIMIIMESFNFMMNSYFFFIFALFESDFELFGFWRCIWELVFSIQNKINIVPHHLRACMFCVYYLFGVKQSHLQLFSIAIKENLIIHLKHIIIK